jgi:hypothetical protein
MAIGWPSSKKPDKNFMNIGEINYRYGALGIHIVIGTQKTGVPGQYEPTYFDQTSIAPGPNARYQPQERVEW